MVTRVPKVQDKDGDFYRIEDYFEEECIGLVVEAANNPGSYVFASFYNFILNCFVKADEQCQGRIKFIEWAYDHMVTRVPKVPVKDVGLCRIVDYSEEECIGPVDKAVINPGSYVLASFYNCILNCFVVADEHCQGRNTYDQFDKLLSCADTVPRPFGLAPPESSGVARMKMFVELELKRGLSMSRP